MNKISFVIPCYRSENTVSAVVEDIEKTMGEREYEIILVNDCSPDGTINTIKALAEADRHIIGVDLAKNFGQHAALMAGFHYVTGDTVVCMDDDGQTPADEVSKLLNALEDGADAVYARYAHKKHSVFRNFGTFMNEKMAQYLLGKPKELFVSSYFAVRRFVADEMIGYTGSFPYVIGLVLRSTKRIVNVDVNHRSREVGRSGYTFKKLITLWVNGFTAFSVKPLRIATAMGAVFAILGFLYGIYTIIKKFVVPDVPLGFSSIMSVLVFIGGMLMLMLGMVGEYIGRMYMGMNNSPQYVIREKLPKKES